MSGAADSSEHEELASYHGALNIAWAADPLHGQHEDPACQLVPGELVTGVMQGSPLGFFELALIFLGASSRALSEQDSAHTFTVLRGVP
jgi:hypothetical protein